MSFHCKAIRKAYPSSQGEIEALSQIEFEVNEQEFICIVGPSGCGKSTLLKIIAGLIEPSQGSIVFHQPLHNGQLRSAMVFQEQAVFPWMTVLDNVAFGLETQGMEKRARREKASEFLNKVGLGKFSLVYPHELSGGMRQRVAILRAFLADPQILLMDEPFGPLDSQTRIVMQEELLKIWKAHKKTVIYVTHDIEEAILLGDRVLVMSGRPGHIREEIQVKLARPRQLILRDHPQVIEMKWHIWKMLEDEVKKDLSIEQ
jgi:NitT/TauT family transport system ATP-binding protein